MTLVSAKINVSLNDTDWKADVNEQSKLFVSIIAGKKAHKYRAEISFGSKCLASKTRTSALASGRRNKDIIFHKTC